MTVDRAKEQGGNNGGGASGGSMDAAQVIGPDPAGTAIPAPGVFVTHSEQLWAGFEQLEVWHDQRDDGWVVAR